MSLIGEKVAARYVSGSHIVDADDIIESAVVELECAMKSFWYLWEKYFSGIKEPDNWKYQYQEISAHITAHKMLMDRITDELLAAYSLAQDGVVLKYAILGSAAESKLQNT